MCIDTELQNQQRFSFNITHEIEAKPNEAVQLTISNFSIAETLPEQQHVTPDPIQASAQASPQVLAPIVPVEPQSVQQEFKKTPRCMVYFGMRSDIAGMKQNWIPCKLLNVIVTAENIKRYQVQFFDSLPNSEMIISGKEFAFSSVNTNLDVGDRVIAMFPHTSSGNSDRKLMPGVIGEKLSEDNKLRYLVFCDYGHVRYFSAARVRQIADSSLNDVHENLKDFITEYLQSYTQQQRSLIDISKGEIVKTARSYQWKDAKVIDIDCSLVKLFFPDENAYEWIYRGSKRFASIFSHEPYLSTAINIDFNQNADDNSSDKTGSESSTPPSSSMRQQFQPEVQHEQQDTPSQHQQLMVLNEQRVHLDKPKEVSKFRCVKLNENLKRYKKHVCKPTCLPKSKKFFGDCSPLVKPLNYWHRQVKEKKANRSVVYRAPCGRLIRNIKEIHKFLMNTKCSLNVDNFDFNAEIDVAKVYGVVNKAACPLFIPDLAEGKEGMKIPVVNAFDDMPPPKFEYSATRVPMEGVNINTDPEFRMCCDCTDDCADKSKCACFQLTIRNYKSGNNEVDLSDDEISYSWKRLKYFIQTGIYECHSGCKCTSRCLNRVVQQPIQIKTQLVRTSDRGWGLESCHDIPNGTFICTYAGRIHTIEDAAALCERQSHGDEYFADLDFIETATKFKDGYETSAEIDSDSDDEKVSEDSGNGSETKVSNAKEPKTTSLRQLYGGSEKPYVMDAKYVGNLGRYFNVSL